MNDRDARRVLRDRAMRRALLEMLHEATRDPARTVPEMPMPHVISAFGADEWEAEELQRILFPKRKRFLGLF